MNLADPDSAQLDLSFARRGDRTVLTKRLFRWPYTLTRSFHLDRVPADMLTVVVQTSSGAIQAGDRLRQRFHVEAGASAHVTGQGATAVHRAASGEAARETVAIEVEAGGLLEFWPDPKILFPEAALKQSVQVRCRPGGTALLADAVLLHDPGGGHPAIRRYESETIVRGDDPEPLLVDRLAIDALPIGRGRRGSLRAFGSVTAILPPGTGIAERLCERIDAALAPVDGLYAAASLLPNAAGVGLRFAAAGGVPLRHALDTAWRVAREVLTGEEPPSRRK